MLLIETIGKRRYAFGLSWIFQAETVLADLTAAGAVGGDDPVYALALGASPRAPEKRRGKARRGSAKTHDADKEVPPGVIGYTSTVESVRGVVSAAAALAGQGDGIYVAAFVTGEWWFCCIRGGVVVPSTDVVSDEDTIRNQVRALSAGLGMEVFSATMDVPGATMWDIDAALRKPIKVPPLRRVKTGSSPVVPILVAATVIACAWGGYRLIFPPAPKLTPEQQQALARQAYVQGVQGVVKTLPKASGWVAAAYALAMRTLPPFEAGWTLQGVSCAAEGCRATYTVEQGDAFALSPLRARFGAAVTVLQDGHSAEVALPVHITTQSVDEGFLRSLRPIHMPLLDWVGSVPMGMPGASISGPLLERHLDRELGGEAAAMPPLTFEQVSVKGDRYLDGALLGTVLVQGARGGFVPVQVAWSYGNGNVPAGWRMTWERLHG